MTLSQAAIEGDHGLHHVQASAHGALRIVFMRLWITKVDQETIAEILRDMPRKALDNLITRVLVGTHHLAVILRVEPPGECGRIHQIAEQHCKLPAFGRGCMVYLWCRCTLGGLLCLERERRLAWGSTWRERLCREACATLAAEHVLCRIHEPAGGTGPGQLSPTATTEVHPCGVGKATMRAQHLYYL